MLCTLYLREEIEAEAAREIAELKANGEFFLESQGFDEIQAGLGSV